MFKLHFAETQVSCVSEINVAFCLLLFRGHFNQAGLIGDLLCDSGYV